MLVRTVDSRSTDHRSRAKFPTAEQQPASGAGDHVGEGGGAAGGFVAAREQPPVVPGSASRNSCRFRGLPN